MVSPKSHEKAFWFIFMTDSESMKITVPFFTDLDMKKMLNIFKSIIYRILCLSLKNVF